MSDSANIHLAGVQINFNAWDRFNLEELTNDGVVFFQYLIFHCQNNAEWTHSDNDLRVELGVKRGRLEKLRELFIELKFLETRITKDRSDNNIRAYRINFLELAKIPTLKKIYREKDHKGGPVDLTTYAEIYKAVAATQPKAEKSTKSKSEQFQAQQLKTFVGRLQTNFKSRRDAHNKRMAEKAKGEPFRTASGDLKFSPKQVKQLENAIKYFDGETEFIQNAWLAFCDALNKFQSGILDPHNDPALPGKLKSPISYFLHFSNDYTERGYSTIWRFGECFAANYGQDHD